MDSFDFLAVMGGTMNIYEHDEHPWLIDEKRFIRQAIDAGKKVLGVCLGGQLIADVLGGPVTKNAFREIGWHCVQLTPQARELPLLESSSTGELMVFQWHGDTFAIPPGAVCLASSRGCANQAFRVWAQCAGPAVSPGIQGRQYRRGQLQPMTDAGGLALIWVRFANGKCRMNNDK
jgi:GMP synthase-like glutamine amidotransferase